MSEIDSLLYNPPIPLSSKAIEQLQKYYAEASLTGPDTELYVRKMIRHMKMEKRIVDGCKALLLLRKAYGTQSLESACKQGLQGSRYNYTIIKTILLNKAVTSIKGQHHLEIQTAATVSCEGRKRASQGIAVDHENLRGPSSFEI